MADSLISKRIMILEKVLDINPNDGNKNILSKIDSIVKQHTSSREERKAIGYSPKEVMTTSTLLQNKWMQTFITLDPCPYLSKVKCPTLALNGDKDCQVLPYENFEAIKKCTDDKAETMLLPNLNHLFQNCTTGGADEYMTIEETFSEEVLKVIYQWIMKKL